MVKEEGGRGDRVLEPLIMQQRTTPILQIARHRHTGAGRTTWRTMQRPISRTYMDMQPGGRDKGREMYRSGGGSDHAPVGQDVEEGVK